MNKDNLNKTLIIAAQMGNLKAIQQAMDDGADINFQGEDGQTALMRAILNQKEKVFYWLLENKADVNLFDKSGKTALMFAYQQGLSNFAHQLIEMGAKEEMKDHQGHTAKEYELEEGEGVVMVQPKKEVEVDLQDLLFASIESESQQGIDQALMLGADLERPDVYGNNALMLAARKGNIVIMRHLIKKGAKPNENVIKTAVKSGNFEAVDLLARHSDLAAKTEVQIALASAMAEQGFSKESIQAIKEAQKAEALMLKEEKKQEEQKEEKAQQQQEEQKEENELLDEEKQEAITNQVKETLQRQEKRAKSTEHLFKLIAHDVQFHYIEDFVRGENDAVEKEDPRAVLTSSVATDIMRFAKERAAELKKDPQELMNNAAASLLYLAAKYNQVDVAKHVLTLRPNFFKEKKDRWGAVHSAASFGNIEVMNEFINFGAELNVDEDAWSSPLEAAIFQGQEAMIKFLFSKGANMRPGKKSELIDAAGSEKTMAGFDALLLRAGKDKEAFRRALFNAAHNGNKEAVQKILKTVDKWGAVAYNQVFKPLKTYKEIFATYALMGAVAGQQKEMASFLIENGADVKADSFVYAAVHKHDAEMLKLLIEKGAIATMPERLLSGEKDSALAEAIYWAPRYGTELVEELIKAGVNPNKKVYSYKFDPKLNQAVQLYTYPILLAAMNQDAELIKFFAQKGNNINLMNKEKQTVLDIFEERRTFSIEDVRISDPNRSMLVPQFYEKLKEDIKMLRSMGAKTAKEIQEERKQRSFVVRLKKALSRD
ncbi:MAG: ankyrin repeat domain-containing protein [Alphaproteobacteria bacterium]|nr:ankyrin repeat domain-containing protein [Alphaproteobacteria bacterium]